MSSETLPVAIVGMGPVGLTLAVDLARQGVRSVLIDTKAALHWTSRATCISRRSQEILQRIGIVPDFFEKALPWNRGKTFHRRTPVFSLDMAFDPARDAHAPFVNLQQFYTEDFLLETARSMPDLVETCWSTAFVAFEQDEEGVTLTLAGPDGENRTLRAAYLVGCDGGRSAVRAATGARLKGRSYEGRYLISDIQMVEPHDQPVERWVWFDPDSNRGSTAILHVQPDRIWRIDIQVDASIPDELLLREDNIRAIVQSHLDMMGIEGDWTLIWRSVYRANALSLDSYRNGRLFLAGDAAHLVPIFGVRGLNSGIDDAHNLAWKLAAVFNESGSDVLLDSYTAERRRATLENLGNAVKSTWFMSPPTEGFRLMRDGALQLAADHDWARTLINPRQSTAHIYADSPCIAEEEEGALYPLPAGSVLPNVPLASDGGHLQDILPWGGFALLVDQAMVDRATVEMLRSHNWAAPLSVVVLGAQGDGMVAAGDRLLLFAEGSGPIMVVRPDEHIVGWARDVADCDALLAIALGKGPKRPVEAPLPVEEAHRLVPPTRVEQIFERLALGIDAGELAITNSAQAADALIAAYAEREKVSA